MPSSKPWEDYSAPKDGPWAYYEKPSKPSTFNRDAFLSGVADAPSQMSGGLLPSGSALRAGAQRVFFPDDPAAEVNKKLEAQGFTIQEAPFNDYQSLKEMDQRNIDAQKQSHPGSYGAGLLVEEGAISAAPALKALSPVKSLLSNPTIRKYGLAAGAAALGLNKYLNK